MRDNAIPVQGPTMAARVVVPQHVVYRCFPNETVVLNLQTGRYHGLNPTAGEILEALEQSSSAAIASATVASAHGLPVETVEADVRMLCSALLERDLIELAEAA
jgi:hypothetical protein